ncbi:hypothetical protein HDU67_004148, partial [Dinochytrium kinnereticum]
MTTIEKGENLLAGPSPSKEALKKKKKSASISMLKAALVQLEEEKRVLEGKLLTETMRATVASGIVSTLKMQVKQHEEALKEKEGKEAKYEMLIASLTGSDIAHTESPSEDDAEVSMSEDEILPRSVESPMKNFTSAYMTTKPAESKDAPSPAFLSVGSAVITRADDQDVGMITASMDERSRSTQALVASLQEAVATLTARCQGLESLLSTSASNEAKLKEELEMQTSRLCHTSNALREREAQLSEALVDVERLRGLLNYADDR